MTSSTGVIVDADIHPVAPRTAIRSRLPARHRRRWDMFGSRVPAPPDIYPRLINGGSRLDAFPAEGRPGSDLSMVQDQLLDEYDIDYGVLNPMQGHFWGAEDPEYAAALCRALNDWIAEEWLDAEPRLRASICVPVESPELAVEEIRRRADDSRFVQVLVSTGGELTFGRRRYWPIYAAAVEAGRPVASHTGGMEQHRGAGWPSFYIEEHVWVANTMAAFATNMICEGLLERFPTLQIVCIEGGIAWAGPLMWSLDDAWDKIGAVDLPDLRKPPSEYLRDHFWFTTQPVDEAETPQQFEHALEHADMDDRILFASDYPHWDFDSPRLAPRYFPARMRENLLGPNACDLYGLTARVPEPVR